jgi:hypothetical protein
MRLVWTSLILGFVVSGCGPTALDVGWESDGPSGIDTDGDGLTDAEEEALGSDPAKVDTDGDGWDDGVEEGYYTDPADRNDHPYTGGWPIDSCRNDLQPTGMAEGDVINDVALLDQYGEEIRLHDFCDHTVLIEHAGFS